MRFESKTRTKWKLYHQKAEIFYLYFITEIQVYILLFKKWFEKGLLFKL